LFLPVVAASVVFPVVYYLAIRAAPGVSWTQAGLASLLLFLMPQFNLFTLHAPEPDGLFVVLLAGVLYGYFRVMFEEDIGRRLFGGFGVLAGLAVLTRPEGIVYTGPLVATAVVRYRRRALALVVPYVAAASIWSAISLSLFGTPWFTGYTPSAYALSHYVTNLKLYGGQVLSGEPVTVIPLVVLILFGCLAVFWLVKLMDRDVEEIVLLPILVGPVVNLAVAVAVDPQIVRPTIVRAFFRHVSYVLPFVVAAGVIGWAQLSANRRAVVSTGVAASVVLFAFLYLIPGRFIWQGHIVVDGVSLLSRSVELVELPVRREAGVWVLDYEAYAPWRNGQVKPAYRDADAITSTTAVVWRGIVGIVIAVPATLVLWVSGLDADSAIRKMVRQRR
jgi:hypothetical protein